MNRNVMMVLVSVLLQGFAATAASAEEPAPRVVTASTSTRRWVVVHDGRSLAITTIRGSLGDRAVLRNGRHNDASRGYAILSEPDGSLLVVRYCRAPCGATRYTIRHVGPDGDVEWTRSLTAVAGAEGPREIAVAAGAASMVSR